MKYKAVMGIEVDAQPLTRSKVFCGCRTDYMALPLIPILSRVLVDSGPPERGRRSVSRFEEIPKVNYNIED